MSQLADRRCVACQVGAPPLDTEAVDALLRQLAEGWEVVGGHHLAKTYVFPDFQRGLDYVNHLGALAEEQGHHPDIYLSWGKVRVEIWTHTVNGLSESDFVLAAKADRMLAG